MIDNEKLLDLITDNASGNPFFKYLLIRSTFEFIRENPTWHSNECVSVNNYVLLPYSEILKKSIKYLLSVMVGQKFIKIIPTEKFEDQTSYHPIHSSLSKIENYYRGLGLDVFCLIGDITNKQSPKGLNIEIILLLESLSKELQTAASAINLSNFDSSSSITYLFAENAQIAGLRGIIDSSLIAEDGNIFKISSLFYQHLVEGTEKNFFYNGECTDLIAKYLFLLNKCDGHSTLISKDEIKSIISIPIVSSIQTDGNRDVGDVDDTTIIDDATNKEGVVGYSLIDADFEPTPDNAKKFSKMLRHHLELFGFHNEMAKVLSTIIIYGPIPESTLYSVLMVGNPSKKSLPFIRSSIKELKINKQINETNLLNEHGKKIKKYNFNYNNFDLLYSDLEKKCGTIIHEINESIINLDNKLSLLKKHCEFDDTLSLNKKLSNISSNNDFSNICRQIIKIGLTPESAIILLSIYLYPMEINDRVLKKIAILTKYNTSETNYLPYIRHLIDANWIRTNSYYYEKGYVLTKPLYDLLLDYAIAFSEQLEIALSDLKDLFSILKTHPGHYANLYSSQSYKIWHLRDTRILNNDDLSSIDLADEKSRKRVSQYLQKSLNSLIGDNIKAKIISEVILSKNVKVSTVLNLANYNRELVVQRYGELLDENIISTFVITNSRNQEVQYAKLSLSLEDYLSVLKTEYNKSVDLRQSSLDILQSLVPKLIFSYKEGFVKLKYLNEYSQLFNLIIQTGISADAAKVLLYLTVTEKASILTALKETNGTLSESSNLEREFLSRKWINVSYAIPGAYFLTNPLVTLLKNYYSELNNVGEIALDKLAKLFSAIVEYQKEIAEKNKKSELELHFLSSFGAALFSYEKVYDNIYDLTFAKIKGKNRETVRVCIAEFIRNNHSKTISIPPLCPYKFAKSAEKPIVLFGYFKEYDQYVVWNFAESYQTLKLRNLVVPLNIFDLSLGSTEFILKKLPSNAYVLTCPNDKTSQAIRYWIDKKAELDDKWLII